MSPLAPQSNRNQTFDQSQQNIIDDARILGPIALPKVTYSIDNLYQMRHGDSRAPNLGNRNVLASISRPEITTSLPNMNFATAISFDIISTSSSRFYGDRRQPNSNRPSIRQSIHSNRSAIYNADGYGDRSRQSNRERNQPNSHPNVQHAKSSSIQIRLSLKNDVKLNEAENAWKPAFLQRNQETEKDDNTELYKQVRSILNKLTAQNFGVLSEQFQNLRIDTKEKLVGVIDLVFNKAVNEPNFSDCYAKLSEYLSHCSKQIDSSSSERAYFKRTLINKCQAEFEQHVANKNATEAALTPLMEKMTLYEKSGDSNGVNEVKAQISEEESILRRRLVSTVRFIGELYKLDMLTTKIMNVCISTLINEAATANKSNANQANEKLECLCKLLTTVGAKLEQKPSDNSDKAKAQYLDLKVYMNQLKRFADNKYANFKPSTRIRFMIMDVIALRCNNWVPKTSALTN